jgi:hypothetical protein
MSGCLLPHLGGAVVSWYRAGRRFEDTSEATAQVGENAGLPGLPLVFTLLLHSFLKDFHMSLSLSIGPLVSLIAGILIMVMPRLLSTIVALYLIVIGVLGLLGMHTLRF